MSSNKNLTEESIGLLVRESTTNLQSKISNSVESVMKESAMLLIDIIKQCPSVSEDGFVLPINYDNKSYKAVFTLKRKK